jgi:uncharacterized protein YjbI with pentapeptide repeats
MSSYS